MNQQTPPGNRPEPAHQKRSWFARHKILTAMLTIVAIIVIYSAVNGGEEQSGSSTTAGAQTDTEGPEGAEQATNEDAPDEDAPAESDAAAIGDAVRDGKFEFTVTEVEPGVSQIGDEYFNEQAQGQFVLVHLTVSNIGEESQMLFGDNQTLVDEQGRQHAANTMAGIHLEGNDTFANEINPGNTVEGTIVFDIPVDAVPASIELHDSAFSGGVSVILQ